MAGGSNFYVYGWDNPNYWIDPFGLKVFNNLYDQFWEPTLEQFKRDHPLEHMLFKQYAENIPVDWWPKNDAYFVYFEIAWREFSPHAKKRAYQIINGELKDWNSVLNGWSNWVAPYLDGLLGLFVKIYSDINFLPKKLNSTDEASIIWIEGPQVINENTWQEMFHQGYNADLNCIIDE